MRALFLAIIIFWPVMASSGQFDIMPGSAPVALPSTGNSDSSFGVGLNRFQITVGWDDDFYGPEETVGEQNTVATNLALTWSERQSPVRVNEWSLLIGTMSMETDDDFGTYFSEAAGGAEMRAQSKLDGYQVGVRYIRATQFASQGRLDWYWGFSNHVSLFSIDGRSEARAVDGSAARAGYDSELKGIFIRPLFSLQPKLRLGRRWAFIPFVAAGFNAWAGSSYWSQDEMVFASGAGEGRFCCEDQEIFGGFIPEIAVGFDVEIPVPFTDKGSFGVGGTVSALMGGDQGSFAEIHLVYAIGG